MPSRSKTLETLCSHFQIALKFYKDFEIAIQNLGSDFPPTNYNLFSNFYLKSANNIIISSRELNHEIKKLLNKTFPIEISL